MYSLSQPQVLYTDILPMTIQVLLKKDKRHCCDIETPTKITDQLAKP